nr:phosphoribosylformylglycinamidine synthase-like [Cherax quadricarinatus]
MCEVLGEDSPLRQLLGDPWLPNLDLHDHTQLEIKCHSTQAIIEIGPRLNFTTAWSTNAVSICHAMGLKSVVRLERANRYLVTINGTFDLETRKQVVSSLHDPMTEMEYNTPLNTLEQDVQTQPWSTVLVLQKGKQALQEANKAMGLAFDEWDLEYYTELFKTKIQRNPTTVELFDLAQSNSEHSRHWFFKGEYVLEGERLMHSLLDMVMGTNSPLTTNPNSIIAFSDNSSCIQGWKTPVVVSSDPCQSSQVLVESRLRHLVFTAETHNFPTGVAPFSGATTGTGGRIRDVQAVGRGGHVVAGTAGYCFGNLHIHGYELAWEGREAGYPSNLATPLEVIIEASNGASDYGNKFGEPVIAGFARSFGMVVGNESARERREWIKPIMFSGGVGTLDDTMVKKLPPHSGAQVVKVGGPVYRIGVGGGAASSVQVQGDNEAMRDLGAVQRGDAEMEQKMNRVIRGCLEMRNNPILAIHDQGAGGNANVLKELMEGAGGVIFTESFSVGDPTLSTLEVWGAEYQESNALLTDFHHLTSLKMLAAREKCPLDIVGFITDDHKVSLGHNLFLFLCQLNLGTTEPSTTEPSTVDPRVSAALTFMKFDFQQVFSAKFAVHYVFQEFHWTRSTVKAVPLKLPDTLKVQEALERVLKLPSVASKRYLTNKVDRSVTGLVARQQCVGPLHTPLADVAVTAASYFSKEGTATSIGEQPIKMLVCPAAGARLTVLEALANLVAAPLSCLKDVKCSANWMWAAKLPGEGWALYQACEAMCEIMKSVGVAVDGGKDSLSMAARVPGKDGASSVVKAPGSLVVSAYAPCPDVTKVRVPPDLKSAGVGERGAGWVRPVVVSAWVAQPWLKLLQLGCECPDVDLHEICFCCSIPEISQLIDEGLVLALHDVSDGGLVTCLLEMAIAGWAGFMVDLPPPPAPLPSAMDRAPPLLAALFSEEVGWVLEVKNEQSSTVLERFLSAGVPGTCVIGTTTETGPHAQVRISVGGQEATCLSVLEAARLWEETSYQLEQRQANPECAEDEYRSLDNRLYTTYTVPFSYRDFVLGPEKGGVRVPQVAVIREEGTNGDREMAAALLQAGFCVHDVTMTDLLAGGIVLEGFQGVIFPGGFSYAGKAIVTFTLTLTFSSEFFFSKIFIS